MESLVIDDTPLAAYLEGRGEAEPGHVASDTLTQPNTNSSPSFAPRSISSATPRHRKSLLLQSPKNGFFSRIRSVYALAVTSTLGNADNVRFLEHFRYTIIASQLLNEHVGSSPHKTLHPNASGCQVPAGLGTTATLTGAASTGLAAFSIAWMLDWARLNQSRRFSISRVLIFVCFVVVLGVMIYAYARRQWLKYLRYRAIETCTDFVEALHAYESSTSSVLSLVQEVQLVSRGYQVSQPLPPISRIESTGESKKGLRLRRSLLEGHEATIPIFRAAFDEMRSFYNQDDLERFLEVYDVRPEDSQQALLGQSDTDEHENESLRHLRMLQHMYGTLRRLVLCSLLAVPATGSRSDILRWRAAIEQMQRLCAVLTNGARTIDKLLDEEEQLPNFSPRKRSSTISSNQSSPTQFRMHAQVRRIGTLTNGTRTLQAKLHLLRDDSLRAFTTSSPDLSRLRDDYDALGTDLRQLLAAWEAGRTALAEDLRAQRLSRVSSDGSALALRSPVHSLGGLTAVDEDVGLGVSAGSPTSALRTLNGESSITPSRPPSPPTTDDDAGEDEIFEAVVPATTSKPGPRSSMTREERIAKMHEEREKMDQARERREARSNMIKELQTVINLRPSSSKRKRADTTGTPARVSL